ncbi:hypothetical protein E2C01_031084 [Portunus trituberculatus]|uniref:Uncharacterized protein n=1 Tax=Portunus trituberculatus TaxID=210409 RepID=A0A5B7EWQ0_PORTR|nr:hypothetical protein [Portunus trituberculatus]
MRRVAFTNIPSIHTSANRALRVILSLKSYNGVDVKKKNNEGKGAKQNLSSFRLKQGSCCESDER